MGNSNSSLTYLDSGVDIDAGEELVKRIKPFVKNTSREGVLQGRVTVLVHRHVVSEEGAALRHDHRAQIDVAGGTHGVHPGAHEAEVAALFFDHDVAGAVVVAQEGFRRLLGEGAMTSAMVPVFAEVLERDGKAGAFRFFSQVFFRLLLGLVVLMLVVMLGIGVCVKWVDLPLNWGLPGELSVLLFPYVLFICLAAIVTAGLNVLGRFAAAASTPMLPSGVPR